MIIKERITERITVRKNKIMLIRLLYDILFFNFIF